MRHLLPLCFALNIGVVSAAVTPSLPGAFEKAYITGTVTADGAPLGNVQLTALGEDGMAMAITAPNGHYALGVGKGTWRVVAARERYATTKPQEVAVQGEGCRDQVDFAMRKSSAQIDGVVVDEAGKPLAQATVMVMPNFFDRGEGQEDDEAPPSMGTCPMATTNGQGRFSLHVTAGSFLLPASRAGYKMSSTNPRPSIPGMESMPPGMIPNLPDMGACGVPVKVAEGEHKADVRIVLAVDPTRRGRSDEGPSEPSANEKPQANVLVGRACLSPNNVLHWSRKVPSERYGFCVVTRDGRALSGFAWEDVKHGSFVGSRYGTPATGYFSFTDATATPGASHRYTVHELGSGGVGPSSNEVLLKTL